MLRAIQRWFSSSSTDASSLETSETAVESVKVSDDSKVFSRLVRVINEAGGPDADDGVGLLTLFDDEKRIAATSEVGFLRIYDVATGDCIASPESGLAAATFRVEAVNSGRSLLTLHQDGVRLLDPNTLQEQRHLHSGEFYKCAITHSGDRVILCGDEVHILNINGEDSLRLNNAEHDNIWAVATSPDDRIVFLGDTAIQQWTISGDRIPGNFNGHEGWVYGIAATDDRLISASADGTVRIWDRTSRSCLKVLDDHNEPVYRVAISQAARRFVTSAADKTVRVWNLDRMECEAVLVGHETKVEALAITRDGKRVISGAYDRTIRIWELNS